jgi:hypothetical protein
MKYKNMWRNKSFRITYDDTEDAEQKNPIEKSFRRIGFRVRKFPAKSTSVKFPTFVNIIRTKVESFESTDIEVVVSKEKFRCHKVILKLYSQYLVKLEANGFKLKVMNLPGEHVTPIAFTEIYNWMLTRHNVTNRTTFAEVFSAAIYLEIPKLMQQLMWIVDTRKFITERVALSLYLEAKEINLKCLQAIMLHKIAKIFLTFVASSEFLMLTYQEVKTFLKSNVLAVNSEIDMVFAAIRWLTYKWPMRMDFVYKVFRFIKFDHIISWQLIELKKHKEYDGDILQQVDVQRIIDEALVFQSLKYHAKLQELKETDRDAYETMRVPRQVVNDPLWKKYRIGNNPNIYDSYDQFLRYLKQINACHWQKIKYVDSTNSALFS